MTKMIKHGTKLAILALFTLIILTGCTRVFTDIDKISSYLSSQKKRGASADDPIHLVVKINLQNTADEESNWQKLLKTINTSGLYVTLDLSSSTMPGTELNPAPAVNTGKKFVVSLILPDTTETIAGVNNLVMFRHFENLTSVSAKNVKIISVAAFRDLKLTSISFPAATEIGLNAFYGTAITEASFPNVAVIGSGAFFGCSQLVSVDFPVATEIGNTAFARTALTTVSFPLVKNIGAEAFVNSATLTSASFPAATSIGNNAFAECKALKSIEIPLVETIGNWAFSGSGLESIDIPLATSIGTSAFWGCNDLATVTLGTLTSANFIRVVRSSYWWQETQTTYITFPGNLRQVYLGDDGGPGTYVKEGDSWTKLGTTL